MLRAKKALLAVALLLAVMLMPLRALAAEENYYKLLGVSRDCTDKELSRAYKRMALKFHPDKHHDPAAKAEAEKKFSKIANAYQVLSDKDQRRLYDMGGEEAVKQGHAGHQHRDPFDFFAQFTGGGFGRRQDNRERKSPSVNMPLVVDLKDLFLGKVIEIEVDKQTTCPHCDGSGAKSSDDIHACSACGGHGVRIIQQQIAPGFYQKMQTTCEKCGGKGKVVRASCPHCKGRKVVRDAEILDVSIEPGMADGDVMTFEGAADAKPDHAPGDINFIIETEPHGVFTRRGDHLYMQEIITLTESLVGFSHLIVHLDESVVALARQTVTPPHFVQVLDDLGMPVRDAPHKRGKLYVEYVVLFPTDKAFTPDDKSSIESLFGNVEQTSGTSRHPYGGNDAGEMTDRDEL